MPWLSKSQTDKIDLVAVDGLSGVNNSLAYKVHELEKHFHNAQSVWGSNSGYMGSDYPIALSVTGGDNAWGTENHIYAGDNIESGSSTKKMDINKFYIVSVSAANKISVVEFLYGTLGTAVTGTVVESTEVYTRTAGGSMFVNDEKIVVNTVTNITGLLATEVYYIIGVSGSTFQLSKTIGGSSAALGGSDGTFSFSKITQTSLTKLIVSKAATTSNADAQVIPCPRIACNNHLFVRAKSESGSTIAIGYLLGLHTYTA
jgi:hypothetical protein